MGIVPVCIAVETDSVKMSTKICRKYKVLTKAGRAMSSTVLEKQQKSILAYQMHTVHSVMLLKCAIIFPTRAADATSK